MRYFIQFLLILGLINPSYAESIEAKSFVNAEQEKRYRVLIDEIRCARKAFAVSLDISEEHKLFTIY